MIKVTEEYSIYVNGVGIEWDEWQEGDFIVLSHGEPEDAFQHLYQAVDYIMEVTGQKVKEVDTKLLEDQIIVLNKQLSEIKALVPTVDPNFVVSQFTRSNVRGIFDQKVVRELNKVINPAGIIASVGSIRYDKNQATGKLTLALTKSGGAVEEGESFEKINWDNNCKMYGLKPEHFGKEVTITGDFYILNGIKPNNRKYPIIATEKLGGRNVKLPYNLVKDALERIGAL